MTTDTGSTTTAAPVFRDWRPSYARRLRWSDLLVLMAVVFGAQILWFGLGNAQVAMRADVRVSELSYWMFS
ncbi:MAG: sugar transferase, partial [Xanthomonas perforans]|nr:sugar transferase [Xanthomonas perforans]